jgi:transcriptional regulator of heat shock response
MITIKGKKKNVLLISIKDRVNVIVVSKDFKAIKGAIFSPPKKITSVKAKEMSNFIEANIDIKTNPIHMKVISEFNVNRLN